MKRKWLIKLFHYEYWPMWAFYLPLSPYFIFKGILNGNLFYFTNANPGMDVFGGMFSDSKFKIDTMFPEQFRTFSIPVNPFKNKNSIGPFIIKMGLNYPLILKPDSGERGEGVLKIADANALSVALENIGKPHLIQEYINLPMEYSLFISFIPATAKYQVVSITEKKYFQVTGNGKSSVQELILKQERGIVFFGKIKKRSEYAMDYQPAMGENLTLHTLGNHCNGTEFINRNDLKSIELDKALNQFMQSVKGIGYGRFDIKVSNSDDLLSLRNFKIIEFNGVAAEPTHIYDSNVGYLNALKTFITHWKLLNNVSVVNRKKGYKPADFKIVINKILNRSILH